MKRRPSDRSTHRHSPTRTFLVGRRPPPISRTCTATDVGTTRRCGVAELYLVGTDGVERLRPEGRFSRRQLDWRAAEDGAGELGQLVLARLTGAAPSTALVRRFTAEVLVPLPDDGFVLDTAEVRAWIARTAQHGDLMPAATAEARTDWITRLGHFFHKHESPVGTDRRSRRG